MAQDPKGEDISDIFPHVAAVAAAYGDPKGKYAAFLQKKASNYKNQPFFFYDQSAALLKSPAAAHSKRQLDAAQDLAVFSVATTGTVVDAASAAGSNASTFPFECPDVFSLGPVTELEYGLFVTCAVLKQFYEIFFVDPDAS